MELVMNMIWAYLTINTIGGIYECVKDRKKHNEIVNEVIEEREETLNVEYTEGFKKRIMPIAARVIAMAIYIVVWAPHKIKG